MVAKQEEKKREDFFCARIFSKVALKLARLNSSESIPGGGWQKSSFPC